MKNPSQRDLPGTHIRPHLSFFPQAQHSREPAGSVVSPALTVQERETRSGVQASTKDGIRSPGLARAKGHVAEELPASLLTSGPEGVSDFEHGSTP